MTQEQEKAFKEMCKEDFERMNQEAIVKWCDLCLFLDEQVGKGHTNFHLTVTNDKSILIHPSVPYGTPLELKL